MVYCVIGHYDYEGDRLLLVTTDEEKAKKEAGCVGVKGSYNSVRVERWDTAAGTQDHTYEYELC